ncbi:DUF6221 family protein [Streptomyces pseudogriseolus]|uniref:DUF6221 family protein n=1 Tax=Streptomyces pseudogriseolus TaxID=36817 RepID=UPI003FA231F8
MDLPDRRETETLRAGVPMQDLVQFLRDRWGEDEAATRTMHPDPVASMAQKFEVDALTLREELRQGKSDRVLYDEGQRDALHWAATVLPERMPPLAPFRRTRILAEIEAKRELLRQYEYLKYDVTPDDLTGVWALEAVLRAFALSHADHPDYNEEWRP